MNKNNKEENVVFKLMPIKERHTMNRCHFCGTDKSVKYIGKVLNPCITASNRFLDIMMCNKCVLLHVDELAD